MSLGAVISAVRITKSISFQLNTDKPVNILFQRTVRHRMNVAVLLQLCLSCDKKFAVFYCSISRNRQIRDFRRSDKNGDAEWSEKRKRVSKPPWICNIWNNGGICLKKNDCLMCIIPIQVGISHLSEPLSDRFKIKSWRTRNSSQEVLKLNGVRMLFGGLQMNSWCERELGKANCRFRQENLIQKRNQCPLNIILITQCKLWISSAKSRDDSVIPFFAFSSSAFPRLIIHAKISRDLTFRFPPLPTNSLRLTRRSFKKS